ncbi:MAG: Asp23/Gls24 family envelope stress response protein [Lachnospiraceae bacterium]|nr:Asp23/Gls24 family envelope stress response protein [Lachnospiraceae bacterium]
MNNINQENEFISECQIKISDDVVASISGLAASEVEGVDSMAGNITNEIVGKLGIKNSSKGVKIEIDGEEVHVDLFINIKYGFRIPDVTSQIQDKVKNSIENMTGLKVVAVNIHVVEIIV